MVGWWKEGGEYCVVVRFKREVMKGLKVNITISFKFYLYKKYMKFPTNV